MGAGECSMANLYIIIPLMALSTFIGAIGSVYLKRGSEKFHIRLNLLKTAIDILKNYQIMTGVVLFLISSVFFIWMLRLADLSILYPMTSLSYIFVTLLSRKMLKEKINRMKVLGIFAIVVGVVLVTL